MILGSDRFRWLVSSLTCLEKLGYHSCHTAERGYRLPTSSHLETELLLRWRSGDQAALQAPIPLVYRDLRLAAHRCLRSERVDHTLQSTELVHEAYLRMAGNQPRDLQQGKIIEMRFSGGLTVDETALALEISPATVKRDWNMGP